VTIAARISSSSLRQRGLEGQRGALEAVMTLAAADVGSRACLIASTAAPSERPAPG
jgi:hypothetical protein